MEFYKVLKRVQEKFHLVVKIMLLVPAKPPIWELVTMGIFIWPNLKSIIYLLRIKRFYPNMRLEKTSLIIQFIVLRQIQIPRIGEYQVHGLVKQHLVKIIIRLG